MLQQVYVDVLLILRKLNKACQVLSDGMVDIYIFLFPFNMGVLPLTECTVCKNAVIILDSTMSSIIFISRKLPTTHWKCNIMWCKNEVHKSNNIVWWLEAMTIKVDMQWVSFLFRLVTGKKNGKVSNEKMTEVYAL